MDGSPPGSAVPGILQARTLEWVAISFSSAWKRKVKMKSLSRVRLFTTPWTAAYQAPPSMEFSRQEYWSGCQLLMNSYFLPPLHLFPGSWTWLGTLSGLKWALSLLESLSTFFQWSHSPVTKTTTLHLLHILYSTPIDLFSAVSCENRSHQKRTSSSNSWTSCILMPSLDPGPSVTQWVCFSTIHFFFSPDSNISHLQNRTK